MEYIYHKDQLVVRPISQLDRDALYRLATDLRNEDTFVMMRKDDPLTLKSHEAYFANCLDRVKDGKNVHLVALLADDLIASAQVIGHRGRESHVGEISISISKPNRGKGVGTLLMGFLESETIIHLPHIYLLYLECMANNEMGRSVYEKIGYVLNAQIPNMFEYRGALVDKCIYTKTIRAHFP